MSATASGKPNIGRPSLYDEDTSEEICTRVIASGKLGKSKAQIAAELDVDRNTLDNWAAAHPEFFRVLTRARDYALAWCENEGKDSVCDPKFQAAFWSRSMAARFPDDYRETARHELTGAGGGPIRQARDLTDDQLAALTPVASGS